MRAAGGHAPSFHIGEMQPSKHFPNLSDHTTGETRRKIISMVHPTISFASVPSFDMRMGDLSNHSGSVAADPIIKNPV